MSYKMKLNFLGKDSVTYNNEFDIPDDIAEALLSCMKDKSSDDQIFNLAGENEVNNFLSKEMEECTAKLFRTAYGTKLLAEELQAHPCTKGMSEKKKQSIYNNACLAVTKKLNHQKNVSKNFNSQMEKTTVNLTLAKVKLAEKEKDAALKLKKILKDINAAKKCFTGEKLEAKLAVFENKKAKINEQLKKARSRVEALELGASFKEETANFAIGTAKNAYSSPEIAYSWCKDNDVDIGFIYSKTLQSKYAWAADVSKDYWKKYPNVPDRKFKD